MGKTIADWYKEYFPFVYRCCLRMLRNEQDAEEISQEVFIRLIKADEGQKMDVGIIKNEMCYLKTIAVRLCLNKMKREKSKDINTDNCPFIDDMPSMENTFEKVNAGILIQEILKNESEETRAYCYMYYFEGMNLTEIAQTAGKSKSLVHKKLETFRKQTRLKLQEIME